ncbi:MAG: hypothetical protein ACLR2E_14810 [Lachnospiraceae bacterium]
MQVTILPVFLMLKKMGLLNKLAGVLFLYIAGISMSCIVFQKFLRRFRESWRNPRGWTAAMM